MQINKGQYKIKVSNPKTNEIIQKKLFSYGCSWYRNEQNVRNTDAIYLYIDNGDITYGFMEHTFINSVCTEIYPNDKCFAMSWKERYMITP